MNIPVIFADGSVGSLGVQELDEQLEKNEIAGFCRASGWAMMAKDKMRKKRDDDTGSWKDRKCNRLLLEM